MSDPGKPPEMPAPLLSAREVAALTALASQGRPVSGKVLAVRMQDGGRETSPAAAHQAAAALTRKGLAIKVQPYDHLLVRYEITNRGREWIAACHVEGPGQ